MPVWFAAWGHDYSNVNAARRCYTNLLHRLGDGPLIHSVTRDQHAAEAVLGGAARVVEAGDDLLLAAGVHVGLKTVILTDSSKVALITLVSLLRRLDMPLIDCQQETAHLSRFGARPISRQVFAAELSRLVNSPHTPGAWKAAALLESDRT